MRTMRDRKPTVERNGKETRDRREHKDAQTNMEKLQNVNLIEENPGAAIAPQTQLVTIKMYTQVFLHKETISRKFLLKNTREKLSHFLPASALLIFYLLKFFIATEPQKTV